MPGPALPITARADNEDVPEGPRKVTIVSSLPLTAMPALSTPVANSIQMALDDAGSKVHGIRIKYVSLDDGGVATGWADEVVNANQAAADPSVVAYIGPTNSPAAKLSIPILCTAGLGMISPNGHLSWPHEGAADRQTG